MPSYIAIVRSALTASAFERWLPLLDGAHTSTGELEQIVVNQELKQPSIVSHFELVCRRIDAITTPAGSITAPNEFVALVDEVSLNGLDAIGGSGSTWDTLIAMLILSYPEIRWVFAFIQDFNPDSAEGSTNLGEIAKAHGFTSLFSDARRDPLLDPTGLRDWVRARTNNALKEDLLARRPELAAAIDEESAFAYFHAYTAYRFGARADIVTTKALMNLRFGSEKKGGPGDHVDDLVGHGYWLLFEDMSLNFPDKKVEEHWLALTDRAKSFPKLDSMNRRLEDSDFRVLITTGQSSHGNKELKDNITYLMGKTDGGAGHVVFKPAKGMFDLWARASLLSRRFPRSPRRGNAPGFFWPKPLVQNAQQSKPLPSHGAPGQLLLISERLLERGESLFQKANSVKQAIVGAVIATDALELIAGRTPTTAFEALSLKHRFEVLAECQFSGVEYHINLGERLQEIEDDSRRIAQCFAQRQRISAGRNAQMNICSQLVRLLRNYNQFDEEQQCMRRVRKLHNQLWMSQSRAGWLMWIPLRYLEVLLSSFSTFVIAVIFWLNAFALMFSFTANVDTATPTPIAADYSCSLQGALVSMFTSGKPEGFVGQCGSLHAVLGFEWVFGLTAASAMVLGYLHLAVLVAHLYTTINRR